MQWMAGKDYVLAYGRTHGYMAVRSETDVRLTRFNILVANSGLAARLVLGVTRTMIVFPLGRGPGRPGGEPELNALLESAKTFAERFEAGGDFEDYPAWRQHGTVHESADAMFDYLDREQAKTAGPAEVLDRPAGRAMLGERTQRLLGMSLADFEAAHAAGTLDLAAPHVAHLVMLLPFAADISGD